MRLSREARESTLAKFKGVTFSQPIAGMDFIEKQERKSNEESRQQTHVSLWPWGYMKSLLMSSGYISKFKSRKNKWKSKPSLLNNFYIKIIISYLEQNF